MDVDETKFMCCAKTSLFFMFRRNGETGGNGEVGEKLII